MAKSTNYDYAVALYDVTEHLKGKELDAALTNFVSLLFHDQKLKQASSIIAEFEKYAKKKAGIVSIEITSARELDDKTISHIKKAFGDKVETTQKINESILGGIIVREENKIFDASLKTQLSKLKSSLI